MNKNLALIQPKVVKILENSYLNNRLSHAYLFFGKKGTYKKDAALYLAMMLYCGVKPCMQCDNCKQIMNLNHPNVYYVAPTGKTIKKEQIIDLQDEFSKTSLVDGPRFYIIDQADTMTLSAMNSLLKFIEEPVGKETYGILLTEHLDNIIPTIRSRSILVPFADLKKEDLKKELVGQIEDKYMSAVTSLVSNVEGAIELVQNEVFTNSFDAFVRFAESLAKKDIAMFVKVNQGFFVSRDNAEMFLNLLEVYFRDLMQYLIAKKVEYFVEFEDMIAKTVKHFEVADLEKAIESILLCIKRISYYTNINLSINELIIDIEEGMM